MSDTDRISPAEVDRPSPKYLNRILDGNRLAFVRAYLIGYGTEVAPLVVRLLIIKLISFTRRRPSTSALLRLWSGIAKLLLKGLRPTGLAMASGVAIGGARLAEGLVRKQVQAIVRILITSPISQKFSRLLRCHTPATTSDLQAKSSESDLSLDRRPSKLEHTIVAILSTFSAASLSSLLAITILQSKHTSALMSQDPLHPTMTPYPTLNDSQGTVQPNSKHPATILSRAQAQRQSPTLDFTLFFTVRALDTLCRSLFAHFSPAWLAFLSRCSDTILFQLCCWRIMWCWFYTPWRLPMSYVKWITTLAEMDPRLLQLIRLAKDHKFVYRSPAQSDQILQLGREIATHMGRPPEDGDPLFIDKLSCRIVHGTLGNSESCTVNVLRRFFRAWKTSLGIYLPVFTVPVLLFQRQKLLKAPMRTGARILLNSSRSAGFLSSFVGLTWAGVCIGRSNGTQRLLNMVIGSAGKGEITATDMDGRVAPQLGSLLAGLSILVENKKRRGEMALYVATRALCATVDEILPRWLRRRIIANRWVSIWVERISFSLSIGIITCAIVHHPDYVRGIVQGILKYAIGPDWPKEPFRPSSHPPPPPSLTTKNSSTQLVPSKSTHLDESTD
ncbi:hypothetical protein PTTG_03707 [Puccinia triticina 1-1 BBBD Race 1]|uniref:Transmembrane protein 135 N-terminal domain-containing protein n=2 Tax=Puccinia triticina TaxID=208348 RepID=A0A0C4ESD3_PUCT1|nr:uncharacterized protein PtA15_3A254 [Puccinia triticina]OAV86995.1 hypothetical protein PTTG_03707 [Puccinia triticina 1-1 BBBD Race 1]WAQ82889.1 hypothetical protein PtA15_3A254 [Puccinia triticina]WAR53715.1 hypothetical protein PtB15_3B224 [Puccinia triticina]